MQIVLMNPETSNRRVTCVACVLCVFVVSCAQSHMSSPTSAAATPTAIGFFVEAGHADIGIFVGVAEWATVSLLRLSALRRAASRTGPDAML